MYSVPFYPYESTVADRGFPLSSTSNSRPRLPLCWSSGFLFFADITVCLHWEAGKLLAGPKRALIGG